MTKPSLEFPSRLFEDQGSVPNLLRRALDESMPYPIESACWHGLVGRRERASRPLRRTFVFAIAVGALSTLCLMWLVRRGHGEERLTAYAEALVPAATASASRASSGLDSGVRMAARDAKLQRLLPVKVESKPQQLDSTAQRSDSPVESNNDTAGCSRMAREGKFEQAAACYGQIAQGSSMTSELALYEKARLESRALGRGATALATLDAHARRFPDGVLSTEVGLTRIELLTRSGRANDALEAIERALAGPIGKERGGDLYALRGDLLSSRGDCPGALAAYASARAAGIHPTRLQAGEKRCATGGDAQDSTAITNP